MSSNDGVTLVLGGIGIKGLANFGTLRAFREQGILIKKIISNGLSSLAAAQYSLNIDPVPLINRISRFFVSHRKELWGLDRIGGISDEDGGPFLGGISYFLRARLFCRSNLRRSSVLSWDVVEPLLTESFLNLQESGASVPLSISAIDLETGQEVLLERGSIVDRLRASLALPGILPPAEIVGRKLVDSSLFCELPLGLISSEDKPVVAIDIPNAMRRPRIKSIIDVLSYADELRGQEIKRIMLEKPDHVITLESPGEYYWGNYTLAPRIVSQAYRETRRLLQERQGMFATRK